MIKVLILSGSRAQIRFIMGVVMERHIIPFQITSGSMQAYTQLHKHHGWTGEKEREREIKAERRERERENKNIR